MKILYVEDNPADVLLTTAELTRKNLDFSLDSVGTLKEALEKIESSMSQPYDLVLSDVHLPDGDGLTLLNHIRGRSLPMPVVIITGQGDEETAVAALKAGADDYIIKQKDYIARLPLVLENAITRYHSQAARHSRQFRVLYAEHNAADADLTRRHMTRYAPYIHLEAVSTAVHALKMLEKPEQAAQFQVVMLDQHLPGTSGMEALKYLLQIRRLDIPVVLVTGEGNEEVAVQAIKLGASDYVVKNPGYLHHLPSVLENAYHRAELAREQVTLRRSEERFRRLAENAPDVIARFHIKPEFGYEYVSPVVFELTGFTPEELYKDPMIFFNTTHPDDRPIFDAVTMGNFVPGKPILFRRYTKDNQLKWLELRPVPIYDESGVFIAVEAITRDVTDRKLNEEHIQRQMHRLAALNTIDNAISSSFDLRVVLSVILEQTTSQLNVDAATILLFHQQSHKLVYTAGRGFRTHFPEGVELRLVGSFAGKAVIERSTVHVVDSDNFESDRGFGHFMSLEGFASYYGVPLITKGEVKGVLEVFNRSPITADAEWLEFFETLAGQAAIAIADAEMFDNLKHSNDELRLAYETTLEGWGRALDLRDHETEGHSLRVAEVTIQLAQAMGVVDEDLVEIRRGVLLHDIGKIAVPDAVLLKPGPLTPEEWEVMRQHPINAYEMLAPINYLRAALDIPYCHHERWDGTGYPRGLVGVQIPLSARVFSVVDVWDALSSDRPYRKAWEKERVLTHIRSLSGIHFDPQVVGAFLKMVEEQGLEHA